MTMVGLDRRSSASRRSKLPLSTRPTAATKLEDVVRGCVVVGVGVDVNVDVDVPQVSVVSSVYDD
jgi:hypothetical protein